MRSRIAVVVTVLAIAVVLLAQSGFTPHTTNVVNSVSFLNQTDGLAATTVYTPTASGNFRVSVCVTAFSTSDTSARPLVWWTDETSTFSPNRFVEAPGYVSTNQANTLVIPVHATAGTPILVQVYADSSSIYDVWVTVEKL